ncbi:MAG: FeoB-associated Cys-rich membrane protein [Peptoniphilus sp.]|nr:FeoB-associated Cys-rich membrane protein [Peptoniphilus sp.]MDD7363651.1 FeoB-associated Cys-rich membrane protein [Bacillota bacterium]MDY6044703.1 FeoB-associated Cys-rich membrane protein [Peptoniphilus sp.]
MGNMIVLALVVLAVFFGIRSMRRSHKEGGCSSCGAACHGQCSGMHETES